jgi:hypothetical protein
MRRPSRHRQRLAIEAARLMFEEGVKQYLDAKRIAARRLLGASGARQVRFRPADLPSNGEIRAELLAMAALSEGPSRQRRLFAMRAVALQTMAALEPLHPRLIGSVASGHIRRGSDIDLHVFTDVEDTLTGALVALGWPHERSAVAIQKDGQIREFLHIHLDRGFPVELSVYPVRERRITTRSSTDGRPIDRVSPARLRDLIAAEHPEQWAAWGGEGEIPGLAEALEEGPMPGRFDGLLCELSELSGEDW